ncbi:MAG: bifunctional demethylmenaquinone methyltransferase/2-methoxy-6-polyprenyl-1,4-benzoquinol methylase UbiE [Bacteroidota bacterium]
MSTSHNRPASGQAEGKRQDVESMFNAIAPKYDLLNRVLSLGIDQYWRKRAVGLLRDRAPRRILDVATGTADLAIESLSLHPDRVVGIDISAEMLRFGDEKLAERGLDDRITLQQGDVAHLPFDDGSFDAVLVAFGVRNFEDLQGGLREIRRVLTPGGALVVLEFSQPTAFPIKQAYDLYSAHVLPRIGQAVSRDSGAYEYLPSSIRAFPAGDAFRAELHEAGYADTLAQPLTFGIASLYKGLREG